MICFTLPISAGGRLLCFLLVCCHLGYILWRDGLLLSPRAVIGIKYQGNGQWQLREQDKVYVAELLGSSTVTQFVTVLRFRIPGKVFKKSCLLLRDSLSKDQYRQLLVILRMSR